MTTLAHDLKFPSTAESWSRFGLALARLTLGTIVYGGAGLFVAYLHVYHLWTSAAPAWVSFAIWCLATLSGCRWAGRAARAHATPAIVLSMAGAIGFYLAGLLLVAWLAP